MIVEYIRYQLKSHTADELAEAYGVAARYLAGSPHCLSYELSRCHEDASSVTLRIEWDSLDGHVQGFRKSAEFQPFLRAIRPFFAEIAEMRHYEPTAIVWRRPT
ncbi:MAG: antibiotic biosynthesis monooxygenase family protein [Hyphomicrobiaceae bacterium]|nr:antibiotic biosynthesis monooxygenase family protein [Hyphomicrobiaceae bacterium]